MTTSRVPPRLSALSPTQSRRPAGPSRPILPSIALVVGLLTMVVSARQVRTPTLPSPRGTASITGLVTIDGHPARPAARAVVVLMGGALPEGQMVVADARGRFAFDGLIGGHYTLSASKVPCVSAYFGSSRPGRGPGTPIAIADGQRVDHADLQLLPGAVIAGIVRAPNGRPQSGAAVLVLDAESVAAGNGTPRTVSSTRTGTDGQYRLYGLPQGRYLVAVAPTFVFSNARVPTPQEVDELLKNPSVRSDLAARPTPAVNFAPTLFPSAVDPSLAAVVAVAEGEVRDGVDIILQLVPSARIVGRVVSADGQPPRGIQLSMISPMMRLGFEAKASNGSIQRVNGLVPTDKDGVFIQPALVPGHYTYFARAASSTDPSDSAGPASASRVPTLWALADLDVDGRDVSDLVLTLQAGVTVSGKLTVDAGSPQTDWSQAQVSIDPTGDGLRFGLPPVHVTADGAFAVRGLVPGDYTVSVAGGGSWTLKAVTLTDAREDLADRGIHIAPSSDLSVVVTMTDRAASIAGRLVDALGRPAPEYEIVVFPADHTQRVIKRRIDHVRPALDGHYIVRGLPPGDYLVAAVTEVDPDDLSDVAFFDLIAATSTHVSLAQGEAHQLDLRIVGRR